MFALKSFLPPESMVNGKEMKFFWKNEVDYYKEFMKDILFDIRNNGKKFKECHMTVSATEDGSALPVPMAYKKNVLDWMEKCFYDDGMKSHYICANSSVSKARSHQESQVFSLKNIVIDLDCHGDSPIEALNKANNLLKSLECSSLPMPNLVCFTGRGVQLWYHLIPCSKKLAFLYKAIADALCSAYESFVINKGFLVDRSASIRISGLFRVPGTFNPKAGVFSQAVQMRKGRYDINALKDILGIAFEKTSYSSAKKENMKNSVRKKKREHNSQKKESAFVQEKSLSSLGFNRMAFLEKYVLDGKPIMSREIFAFLYHNAACLAGCTDPVKAVFRFNGLFPVPLKDNEIWAMIRCSDKKNYHISNEKFFEIAGIHGFMPKQKTDCRTSKEKNRARDQKRKQKKDALVKQIQMFYRYGRTKQYIHLPVHSIKEIAGLSGCSVNTVLKYIKPIKAGIDRSHKFLLLAAKLKKERKKRSEFMKEMKKDKDFHKTTQKLHLYKKARFQKECVQYALGVLEEAGKRGIPSYVLMDRLWKALWDVCAGKSRAEVLIRAGLLLDRYRKVHFKSRDQMEILRLSCIFPMAFYFEYIKGYFPNMESLEKTRVQNADKIEECRKELMQRQEIICKSMKI